MLRRDFLTGAAALAAFAGVREAEALTPQQRLVLLGGAGNTPAPPADADFSNPNNSQVIVILAF